MRRMIFLISVSLALVGCKNPAEEAVAAQLIDSESARFRDVERCSNDREIWRGEVNAKNRMGAYTGFEPFFYDGVSVVFVADSRFSDMMNRCYSNITSATDEVEAAAEAMVDAAEGDSKFDHNVTGKWLVTNDVNPLDDSKTTIVSLDAVEGVSRFEGPVRFVARCKSNTTEVYVVWHEYLGDDGRSVYDDYKNVMVRIGDSEAQTQRWDVSTDNEATFAPAAIDLLRKISGVERLVVQTTPYNEAPMTAVFDLEGGKEAIGKVAETCGWEL